MYFLSYQPRRSQPGRRSQNRNRTFHHEVPEEHEGRKLNAIISESFVSFMGVPAIAFAIPAVLEIEAGIGCLMTVKPLDVTLFSQVILQLADSPEERVSIGEKGRARVMVCGR